MPHIIVKHWPGKSEEQKRELTELIVQDCIKIFGSKESSLSVAFEEIEQDAWTDQVYEPDIKSKWDELYKKPGY